MKQLAPYAKAIASLIVCAAAYLVGTLSGDQTLADLTTLQWLGGIVFVGSAYGITYAVPNRPKAQRKPRRNDGQSFADQW